MESAARADSLGDLVVVRGAEGWPVSNMRHRPIEHRAKDRTMQRSDGDFGLISGGDVVHDIDVEVFRILSGGLDLAIF